MLFQSPFSFELAQRKLAASIENHTEQADLPKRLTRNRGYYSVFF